MLHVHGVDTGVLPGSTYRILQTRFIVPHVLCALPTYLFLSSLPQPLNCKKMNYCEFCLQLFSKTISFSKGIWYRGLLLDFCRDLESQPHMMGDVAPCWRGKRATQTYHLPSLHCDLGQIA